VRLRAESGTTDEDLRELAEAYAAMRAAYLGEEIFHTEGPRLLELYEQEIGRPLAGLGALTEPAPDPWETMRRGRPP
jgi:hypothetical protein